MSMSAQDFQIIILASGTATRLRPLSLGYPKALCPVCNVSLLARIIANLHGAGISGATVTLPPAGTEITERALAAAPVGFDLHLEHPTSSGTVSTVRRVLDMTKSGVVVIYGDNPKKNREFLQQFLSMIPEGDWTRELVKKIASKLGVRAGIVWDAISLLVRSGKISKPSDAGAKWTQGGPFQ
jgi:NDP-sugar pyrophosphorylase family protein